jgi:hypothetical protein
LLFQRLLALLLEDKLIVRLCGVRWLAEDETGDNGACPW